MLEGRRNTVEESDLSEILLSDHDAREGDLVSCDTLMRIPEEVIARDPGCHDDIRAGQECSIATSRDHIRESEFPILECIERIQYSRNIEISIAFQCCEFL